MAKELTFTEKKFCHEYINNGQNGKQAYLVVKPSVLPDSATVQASKYLARANVKEYINSLIDNQYISKFANKFKLLSESEEVRLASMEEKEYGHAIKAIDLKGKIAGVYTAEQTDLTDYKQIMQSLTINVNTVNLSQNSQNLPVEPIPVNTDKKCHPDEKCHFVDGNPDFQRKKNSFCEQKKGDPHPRLRSRYPLSEVLEETTNDDTRRQSRQVDDKEDIKGDNSEEHW